MTTELVLLLAVFAFILGGVFFSEKGPLAVFQNSGPRMGARLEQQLTIGREFNSRGSPQRWEAPQSPAPTGQL